MEFFKEVVVGEVDLGRFLIAEVDDEHIWITAESGEGGQFKKSEFEKVVETFYRENF